MFNILHTSTVHKTALLQLAYEDNSAYCQSSNVHNIKHIYRKWPIKRPGRLFNFYYFFAPSVM